jgi:PAS domain S-box-containing protein
MSNVLEQDLREMNAALLVSSIHQHELTEQAEQAEIALRDSEARYRTLFNLGPVAIYSCDAAGVIQKFNRRAAELWGREPVRGDTTQLFCGSFKLLRTDGSLLPFEQCPMADVVSGKLAEARDAEVFIERPDGSRVTVIANIRPLIGPDGQILGAINSFYDVTDRKQLETALRASEIRYRRLFEASQDGILMVDATHFRITAANPYMLNLLGCPYEELIDKELWQIGLLGDADASRAMVRDLHKQGYVRYDNLPLETAAGRRIQVEVIANLYEEDHQSVIQCNVRDITERRDLERQATEQADALAEISRNKDEFLATLAHELRNPLAPIRNAVQVLGLENLAELDASLARSMIDRQVTVMVRLIDDLLDVSRISRNKLDIRKQRVELGQIIATAVESGRPLITQCGHELTISLPPEPVHLDADPVRVVQIILNLLNNAAKYTPPRGHIWLTACREGSDAVVSVRDNGIGIPDDMLARIFDMFTQVDRSLEQSQGGLGIGLTLVRRLVEMHDGTIEVRSAGINQGSEFMVRLPLPIQPHQVQHVASGGPRAKALSGCRILVVDDNKDSADSLAMVLRRKNNDVRVAYNGLEAVKAAEAFRPGLVLLDIGLPKLNGYEVARRIRQQPWSEDVIIVALTGWGQDEDRRRSHEAGFDLHLVKPVELAALESLLAGR